MISEDVGKTRDRIYQALAQDTADPSTRQLTASQINWFGRDDRFLFVMDSSAVPSRMSKLLFRTVSFRIRGSSFRARVTDSFQQASAILWVSVPFWDRGSE
jgi:hypothetical protein